MFGGIATRDIPTNNVFIFTVTHNTIVRYHYVHVQYICIYIASNQLKGGFSI